MGSSVPPEVVNQLFSQRLESGEGKEKLAQLGATWIKDKLREESFARKLVPLQGVTKSEPGMQVSLRHDTLSYVDEIEPQSRAMAVTFRGDPTPHYVSGPRYEIPFFRISSERFEKTEEELMAYRMPITKVIEKNSIKDLQQIEDRQFLLFCEMAVQALQVEANGGVATALNATNIIAAAVVESSVVKGEFARAAAVDNFVNYPVQKEDFIRLFQTFVGEEGTALKVDRFLLTDHDFWAMMSWTTEEVGNKVASETIVDGYKYTQVMGIKYIRTLKTDILRNGNVYAFTTPEFFGRFLSLVPVKFYIDKVVNRIQWECWETIGMGIGNIASVRKLELYSGSVTPTVTDAGFAARLPMAEEDLGAENNRVTDGQFFPHVFTY